MGKRLHMLQPPQKSEAPRVGLAGGEDAPPPLEQRPAFSLQYVDKKYCLSKCQKKEKAAFADTIHRLSRYTWAELMRSPRHGVGCEKIPQYHLTRPVPPHLTPDVTILAFRFFGKAPMVGYKHGRVFYVIWFDRKYTLYSHGR